MEAIATKTAAKTRYIVSGTVACQICRASANVYRREDGQGIATIQCDDCGHAAPLIGYCHNCN